MNNMEEYLGISFTNRSLSLAKVKEGDQIPKLLSAYEILYPFPFEYNALLKSENLEILGEKLKQFVENNNLNGSFCNISLPMYLAQMKRAPLPLDLDNRILQKQIVWELENINSVPIEESKVIKLAHDFSFGSYYESVFVLIQKKAIETIKKFVEGTGLKLKKLVLDSDTLLKFLMSFNLLQPAKNQIVFQVDVFNIAIYQYLDGKFYSYELASVTEKEKEATFEQKVLKIVEEKMENFLQLVNSLPGYEYPVEAFITRLITENLSKKLKEANHPVEELILNHVLNEDLPAKNIESFAVIL